MEIATATQTSDATVVRAIQALGFAGLRELKQTMERWFGTSVTSAEKDALDGYRALQRRQLQY